MLRVREKSAYVALASLFFAALFVLLLARTMHKPLSRDEHLFVTGGSLVSQGLVPYRDFPYMHMPYQAQVFSLIHRFTNHELLGARVVVMLAGLASLVAVFSLATVLFADDRPLVRFAYAASFVLLVFTNPLFTFTSGTAWNHDLSVLFALLAFIAHYRGIGPRASPRLLLLSGVLLGIAVGIRVSFLLALIPFVLTIFLASGADRRTQVRLGAVFLAGAAAALLPALIAGVLHAREFLFNNFEFFLLNTEWREVTGYTRTMTLGGKLRYIIANVLAQPGTLVLTVAYALCGFVAYRQRGSGRTYAGGVLAGLLIPFLLIGSVLNTPVFYQYFYAPVPFLAVGIMFGIASLRAPGRREYGASVLAVAVVVSVLYSLPPYLSVGGLLSPSTWVPMKVHDLGGEVRSVTRGGRVLTLAPIIPLEGDLEIYHEFAPGPFIWRSAHLLPLWKRQALGLVASSDLYELLQNQPPRAILVGFEERLEAPLIRYARANGFRRVDLSDGKALWLNED
jgi:hypothetical protein